MKKTSKLNVEYATLTIVPSLKELYTDNIEYRSEAEYIKARLKSQALHYPQPIIYTVNDKNKLDKGKNS